ncbi:MAG: hypothetical protein QOK36_4384 [Gaiellales bacterium]|jgi:hypothetical protein|nr:hypothetical protein [Gaiellales bacterium]
MSVTFCEKRAPTKPRLLLVGAGSLFVYCGDEAVNAGKARLTSKAP